MKDQTCNLPLLKYHLLIFWLIVLLKHFPQKHTHLEQFVCIDQIQINTVFKLHDLTSIKLFNKFDLIQCEDYKHLRIDFKTQSLLFRDTMCILTTSNGLYQVD